MRSIERYAWWLPAITAAVSFVVGLSDLLGRGPGPYLAQAVTGESSETLSAGSPQAYRLIEAQVQIGGIQLMIIGVLLMAIVLFAFRRNLRWAWWTMWSLPILSAGIVAVQLTTVAPGQVPDGSVYTATVVALLNAGALLVSAPRFFVRSPHRLADG
jgi:hypothetical protein